MGQVAIYCRVSTDDQSCERQERELRAFAKRAGHKIVGVFKETASGARNDRVERNKVMALARNHEIDAILVTELSRWGRSTQDLVSTLWPIIGQNQGRGSDRCTLVRQLRHRDITRLWLQTTRRNQRKSRQSNG